MQLSLLRLTLYHHISYHTLIKQNPPTPPLTILSLLTNFIVSSITFSVLPIKLTHTTQHIYKMRIQVLVPLIIGLAACGIGSAFIYHQLKEQQKDDKKKRRSNSESDPDHPLTSIDVITSAELSIHNEFVPAIVGKDSLNLKSLEAKTRTRISFKTSRTSDDHHTCVIEGTLDAIEDARKIILMIASKPPVLVTEQLDVSQSACGKIIGRCGEMLQEICRKSNAKVSVNSNETSNQRQVVITGTRMQVSLREDINLN